MRKIKIALALLTFTIALNVPAETKFEETRYCYGDKHSADVVAAFRRIHPCPTTGLSTGSCPNWAVDHVIPLVVGGCDSVSNLQWLPNEIKSCAGTVCKDRWERKVYERVIVDE